MPARGRPGARRVDDKAEEEQKENVPPPSFFSRRPLAAAAAVSSSGIFATSSSSTFFSSNRAPTPSPVRPLSMNPLLPPPRPPVTLHPPVATRRGTRAVSHGGARSAFRSPVSRPHVDTRDTTTRVEDPFAALSDHSASENESRDVPTPVPSSSPSFRSASHISSSLDSSKPIVPLTSVTVGVASLPADRPPLAALQVQGRSPLVPRTSRQFGVSADVLPRSPPPPRPALRRDPITRNIPQLQPGGAASPAPGGSRSPGGVSAVRYSDLDTARRGTVDATAGAGATGTAGASPGGPSHPEASPGSSARSREVKGRFGGEMAVGAGAEADALGLEGEEDLDTARVIAELNFEDDDTDSVASAREPRAREMEREETMKGRSEVHKAVQEEEEEKEEKARQLVPPVAVPVTSTATTSTPSPLSSYLASSPARDSGRSESDGVRSGGRLRNRISLARPRSSRSGERSPTSSETELPSPAVPISTPRGATREVRSKRALALAAALSPVSSSSSSSAPSPNPFRNPSPAWEQSPLRLRSPLGASDGALPGASLFSVFPEFPADDDAEGASRPVLAPNSNSAAFARPTPRASASMSSSIPPASLIAGSDALSTTHPTSAAARYRTSALSPPLQGAAQPPPSTSVPPLEAWRAEAAPLPPTTHPPLRFLRPVSTEPPPLRPLPAAPFEVPSPATPFHRHPGVVQPFTSSSLSSSTPASSARFPSPASTPSHSLAPSPPSLLASTRPTRIATPYPAPVPPRTRALVPSPAAAPSLTTPFSLRSIPVQLRDPTTGGVIVIPPTPVLAPRYGGYAAIPSPAEVPSPAVVPFPSPLTSPSVVPSPAVRVPRGSRASSRSSTSRSAARSPRASPAAARPTAKRRKPNAAGSTPATARERATPHTSRTRGADRTRTPAISATAAAAAAIAAVAAGIAGAVPATSRRRRDTPMPVARRARSRLLVRAPASESSQSEEKEEEQGVEEQKEEVQAASSVPPRGRSRVSGRAITSGVMDSSGRGGRGGGGRGGRGGGGGGGGGGRTTGLDTAAPPRSTRKKGR